ncbi:hypothetical protein TNCV_596211 [Trichonephila clavipes]|nr:hypothetical protein TNCV_596211 [Trichonephila clavipes]
MLQTYVIPTLQQRACLQETIFMHDGAPPHNSSIRIHHVTADMSLEEPRCNPPRTSRIHSDAQAKKLIHCLFHELNIELYEEGYSDLLLYYYLLLFNTLCK